MTVDEILQEHKPWAYQIANAYAEYIRRQYDMSVEEYENMSEYPFATFKAFVGGWAAGRDYEALTREHD